MEEDSLKDAALVLVIQGCFSVSQTGDDGKERLIHNCYPGGLLGQLQVGVSPTEMEYDLYGMIQQQPVQI